jgi:hypothetical protein
MASRDPSISTGRTARRSIRRPAAWALPAQEGRFAFRSDVSAEQTLIQTTNSLFSFLGAAALRSVT